MMKTSTDGVFYSVLLKRCLNAGIHNTWQQYNDALRSVAQQCDQKHTNGGIVKTMRQHNHINTIKCL